MEPQSIEEAFARLGVEVTASADQIQAAFREKTKTAHPDIKGGDADHSEQAALNSARDMALAFAANRNALVRISQNAIERYQQQSDERHKAGEVVKSTIEKLRKQETDPIRRRQQLLGIIGVVTFVASQFGDDMIADFVGYDAASDGRWNDPQFKMVKLSLFAATVVFGVFSLVLQRQIERLNHQLEDWKEQIGEKEYCARLLAPFVHDTTVLQDGAYVITDKVADEVEHTPLSELLAQSIGRMREDTGRPPTNPFEEVHQLLLHGLYVPRISAAELARTVILRSIEHGLLETVVNSDGFASTPKRYKIRFNAESLLGC